MFAYVHTLTVTLVAVYRKATAECTDTALRYVIGLVQKPSRAEPNRTEQVT